MFYAVEEIVLTDYNDMEMGQDIRSKVLFVTESLEFAKTYVEKWNRPGLNVSGDKWADTTVELHSYPIPFVESEFINLSPKDICGDKCYWRDKED